MLRLDAKTSDHEGIEGKVKFAALAKMRNEGGKQEIVDNTVNVKNANSVTIFISIGTNFNNYNNISGNALARAEQYMAAAGKKNFTQSLASHSAFYRKFFDRVSLDLGETDQAKKTTDRKSVV